MPVGEVDAKLKVAPALEESVSSSIRGVRRIASWWSLRRRFSTFGDIDELVREFAIAGIMPGSFLYVPYQSKDRGQSQP